MGSFGDLRGPVVTYGGVWGPMGADRYLHGAIGTYENLWGPLGAYGDLWGPMGAQELLQLIADHQGTLSWYKVPSHVQIEGNERANDLAEWGRQQNPLYREPPGDREEGREDTEANHIKVIIFSHKHPSPPEPAVHADAPPPPVVQEPPTLPCATPSTPISGTQSDTHNMVTALVTPIRVPVSASPLCRDTPARLLLNQLGFMPHG